MQRARNVADAPRVADLLAEAAATGRVRPLDAQLLLQSAHAAFAHAAARPSMSTSSTPLTAALFRAAVARRAAGEPLAYITGVREFWSLPLVVTPAVLVPRPETELLVELCLARLDQLAAPGGGPWHRLRRHRAGTGAASARLDADRHRCLRRQRWKSPPSIAQRLGIAKLALRAGSWCDALPAEPLRCHRQQSALHRARPSRLAGAGTRTRALRSRRMARVTPTCSISLPTHPRT